MSSRAAVVVLFLAACAGDSAPSSTARAVTAPCVGDVQGYGGLGYGWLGLRDDGTVWRGSPAQKVHELGADVVAVADVDGESLHQCAIRADGTLWCWGNNGRGQCGTGVATPELPAPSMVVGLPAGVASVSVSWDFTCALLVDGTVWCWGANSFGQLGDGTFEDRLTPVQVPIGAGNDQISAGYDHTCALEDGVLSCWGGNLYGQIGAGHFTPPGPTHPSPTTVPGGPWQALSAGGYFTCAIDTSDQLWCWGDNVSGHLGLGTGDTANRHTPALVPAMNDTAAVDTGVRSACGLKNDGSVWCWGYQGGGRLGDGVDAMTQREAPMAIAMPPAATIRVTEGAGCATTTTGALWCWGWGFFLDGTAASSVPVEIDLCGLPSISSLSPPYGSTLGGSVVTINGDEFTDGAEVYFGNTVADEVTSVTATQIVAVAPMHWESTEDVRVELVDGKVAVLPDSFQFLTPPAVWQVAPASGPTAGGTTVTILGSALRDGVTVTFGGVVVDEVTITDEGAELVTPPHAPGLVEVVVTNFDGQTDTLVDAFEYVIPPTPISLFPSYGPVEGNTRVVITGEGFNWTSQVYFDDVLSPSITFVDENTVSAYTPPHEPGLVDVRVTNEDGQSGVLEQVFDYGGSPADAGAGGDGGGPGVENPGTGGCVCEAGSGRGRVGWGGVGVLLAAALALRTRRARR